MMRLTLKRVRLVFCAAWRLAKSPTRRPSSVKATHEGVVRSPSELASTCASPSFHTDTHAAGAEIDADDVPIGGVHGLEVCHVLGERLGVRGGALLRGANLGEAVVALDVVRVAGEASDQTPCAHPPCRPS